MVQDTTIRNIASLKWIMFDLAHSASLIPYVYIHQVQFPRIARIYFTKLKKIIIFI